MTTAKCPCCGGEIAAYDPAKLEAIVSPQFAEIVRLLLKTPGQYVETERIARHIWRNCSDGGPINPAVNISNMMAYNKRRLAALGWQVSGRIGRCGGYRITTIEGAP